jgi:hypothetical protein
LIKEGEVSMNKLRQKMGRIWQSGESKTNSRSKKGENTMNKLTQRIGRPLRAGGLFLAFVVFGLVAVLFLSWSAGAWATPGQSPLRQTVPPPPGGQQFTIPPEGGTITPTGNISITIPAGVLTDTAYFNWGPQDPGEVPDPPPGFKLGGCTFSLEAYVGENTPLRDFNPPGITICFNYCECMPDVCDWPQAQLELVVKIQYYDPDVGDWAELATTFDTGAKTACVTVTHVSSFALMSHELFKGSHDFDGDGKSDVVLYRDGVWFIKRSSDGGRTDISWGGLPQDIPFVGDFDGDGISDAGIYRDGAWFIKRSSDGGRTDISWGGLVGDVPLVGDFDGDAISDVGIYRNGWWFIRRSSDGGRTDINWGGLPQDIPVNRIPTQ